MKIQKIILSLFLFLTFFSSSFKPAFANCTSRSGPGCSPSQVFCGGQCCDAPSECSTPPISGDISDPTCLGGNGIDTAIGCIPVNDTNAFMGWVLGWAVGIGGGIAFLLIVYASFMVMTSQGVPDRLKAGQELLTSAISGLIMLIFAVFILKFIGVDILHLDNFGFNN